MTQSNAATNKPSTTQAGGASHVSKEETQKTSQVLPEQPGAVEKPKHVWPKAPKPLEPLQPGLAYFEAPDGRVKVGEASKDHLWLADLHGPNKGGWINKKR